MSNQPVPYPLEATFRDLRGAVYAGGGRRLALAQGVRGAAGPAGAHTAELRNLDLNGATRTSRSISMAYPSPLRANYS